MFLDEASQLLCQYIRNSIGQRIRRSGTTATYFPEFEAQSRLSTRCHAIVRLSPDSGSVNFKLPELILEPCDADLYFIWSPRHRSGLVFWDEDFDIHHASDSLSELGNRRPIFAPDVVDNFFSPK